MRWLLLLLLIISCADNGDGTKVNSKQDSDVAGEPSKAIYGVYQYPNQLVQDNLVKDGLIKIFGNEPSELTSVKFPVRINLTANGYPDSMHVVIDLTEVQELKKEDVASFHFFAKAIPITPLPSMYILPLILVLNGTTTQYAHNLYMTWNHDKQQINKLMMILDYQPSCSRQLCRTSQGKEECSGLTCKGNKTVFIEMEKMPYDQQQAKTMYLKHKTLRPPADQWSLWESLALYQMIKLLKSSTASPTDDLDLDFKEKLSLDEITAAKLQELLNQRDKIIEHFSTTNGVHISYPLLIPSTEEDTPP